MNEPLLIDYYSDLLCVWAWIAQRRIDELETEWGDRIVLRHQCVDVFGDTAAKMDRSWRDRGGYEGFGRHVAESASRYADAPVHPDVWTRVRPKTSANAHLVLKAVELADSHQRMVRLGARLRRAFFVEARDIGKLDVVMEHAAEIGVDRGRLRDALDSGQAMAALMSDHARATQQGIQGSPSWVMNEGRQVLYGNVGYRVLRANVEELLRHPEQEASWCH